MKDYPCERWVQVPAADFKRMLSCIDDKGCVWKQHGDIRQDWKLRRIGNRPVADVRPWRTWTPDKGRLMLGFHDTQSLKVPIQPQVNWVVQLWKSTLSEAAHLRKCEPRNWETLCAADACAAGDVPLAVTSSYGIPVNKGTGGGDCLSPKKKKKI